MVVTLVQYMIRTGDREKVRVTKIKGHAEDSDVQESRVRLEDQLGNAEADIAADLGRRHQSELLIDAGTLSCYSFADNHDGRGGTAPDPLVWDQGGPKKARKLDIRVNVDLASLPGPPGFLGGPWIQVHGGGISATDICQHGHPQFITSVHIWSPCHTARTYPQPCRVHLIILPSHTRWLKSRLKRAHHPSFDRRETG